MLSPHEFATLILIDSSAQQAEFDPQDLRALAELQLIKPGDRSPGIAKFRVTDGGRELLNAFTQVP